MLKPEFLSGLAFTGMFLITATGGPMLAADAASRGGGGSEIIFFDNFESDECFPYDPDPRFETIAGAWPAQFTEQLETFTVPAAQRGGGIIDVSLTSGNSDVRPRLFACVDAECSGGSIVGHTNTDGGASRVRFQAAAGQQYRFILDQFGNAPADEYPVDSTLTIDYSDRLDCWEANNQIQQARLVAKDQSVFAYMIEGYRQNSLTTGTYQDWYRFDLRQEAFIEVNIPQPAGQHLMRVQIFDVRDDTGADVLVDGQQDQAGQSFTAVTTRIQEPGTYYIRIRLALSDNSTVSGSGPAPEHWQSEYQMIVNPRL